MLQLRPSVASRCPLSRRPTHSRILVVRRVGEGVQDLLARDRKSKEVDLSESPFSGDPSTSTQTTSTSLKSRSQRRAAQQANQDSKASRSDPNRPKRCKEAIDRGLALFQNKEYEQAIAMFNLALELPGNGAYRLPGSPREYLCPSDAEENAVLYNMACAWAQLGQKTSALTCLEACLENGFEDYNTIRSDPDLAPIRGQELDSLLGKHDGVVAKAMGVFGSLTQKKPKTQESREDGRKPWIMW